MPRCSSLGSSVKYLEPLGPLVLGEVALGTVRPAAASGRGPS